MTQQTETFRKSWKVRATELRVLLSDQERNRNLYLPNRFYSHCLSKITLYCLNQIWSFHKHKKAF